MNATPSSHARNFVPAETVTFPSGDGDTRDSLARLQDYLAAHAGELLDALGFVAGTPGIRSGQRLIAAAQAATSWSSDLRQRLDRLRGLLQLEHLDDAASPFPFMPATLDPERPEVDNCCRHADALEDLLEAACAHGARPDRAPAH